MIKVCDDNQCTGCAACANCCPRQCIQMQPDIHGFIHPKINNNECINCALCVKTCPANIQMDGHISNKAFAAWSLSVDDRNTSTSGGVASVFSQHIIDNGGIVYGSAVCNGSEVNHIRISDRHELYKLKGSKYVQSNINNCFKIAKEDLKSGKPVLFTGTPCQIAGLRQFLSKEYKNLITVDIICHGVPSISMLHNHMREICDIDKISNISFREKKGYILNIMESSKTVYRKAFPYDSYLNGFMYGLFHRPSCYECHYARPYRVSDITIGDYWGLGVLSEVEYSKEKVSVVLPNTEKGKQFLASCSDKLFLEERPIEEAINGNSQLQQPTVKHEFYNLFRTLYPRYGYKTTVDIVLCKFYIKNFIYKILIKISFFKKMHIRR